MAVRDTAINGESMVKSALFSLAVMICLAGISCKETPESWNKKAAQAFAAGNYRETIRCYEQAIGFDPDNLIAHYFLGWLYQLEGKPDSAIPHYKKAIALQPERKELYNRLGETYLAQGKIDEALAEFRKALARDADFAAARCNLGMAYKTLGKNTTAAQHLYEAGLLAFFHGDKNIALRAYRALEETGPERIVQELGELIEPILEEEIKGEQHLYRGEGREEG